jgi:hypothetical protein
MNTLKGMQYSLKQQIQFRVQNKVLDPLALKLIILLHQLHCIFLSLVWGDFEQRWYSDPWKHWELDSIPITS